MTDQARLCAGCGVVAPPGRTTCEICTASLASSLEPPKLVDDLFWVGVECTFECRVCGHRSPLDHLDVDGSVMCLRCGVDQKFDGGQWSKAIEHAHAVGDLAGSAEGRFPDPELRLEDNDHAGVGVRETFAEETTTSKEKLSLVIRAMPGHPLCDKCHVPLAIAELAGQSLTTTCPSCKKSARYDRPASVPKKYGALRAVVADEHEHERREAKVDHDKGGAVLVRCPNCAAPLPVSGKSSVITCEFCSAMCRIPSRALRGLGHDAPKALLWWMLFSGPSIARKRLLQEIRQQRDKQAQREAREAQQRASAEQARFAPRPVHVHVHVPERKKKLAPWQIAAIVATVVVMPTLGYYEWRMEQARSTAVASSVNSPSAAVKKAEPPPKPEPIAILLGATVTKSDGGPVKPKTRCLFDLETTGANVVSAKLTCDTQVLYDSSAPISGMSQSGSAIVEAHTPSGWVYAVAYNDVGQRTGRTQLQLDGSVRQAKVQSSGLPEWTVMLEVDPTSEPRTGSALQDHGTVSWDPFELALTVTEATGPSPVKNGASCTLRASAFVVGAGQRTSCRAKLWCKDKVIYDTERPGSSVACSLDANGKPRALDDSKPTPDDKDPAVTAELAIGTVTVHDTDGKRAWQMVLAK